MAVIGLQLRLLLGLGLDFGGFGRIIRVRVRVRVRVREFGGFGRIIRSNWLSLYNPKEPYVGVNWLKRQYLAHRLRQSRIVDFDILGGL